MGLERFEDHFRTLFSLDALPILRLISINVPPSDTQFVCVKVKELHSQYVHFLATFSEQFVVGINYELFNSKYYIGFYEGFRLEGKILCSFSCGCRIPVLSKIPSVIFNAYLWTFI